MCFYNAHLIWLGFGSSLASLSPNLDLLKVCARNMKGLSSISDCYLIIVQECVDSGNPRAQVFPETSSVLDKGSDQQLIFTISSTK